MLNILKNTINRVFVSGVDSDASAFITATGLSGTTQKSAITTLVKDLKSSGLWSKMKAVYPMVTDNYNLLSYSEDFINAAWSNDQASTSANQTTAPNGTLTADKLIENTVNNHHLNYQSIAASVGQLYTFSVYLKAAERQYASVQVADSTAGAVNRYTALIDLTNGVILNTRTNNSPTNTSNSITSVGNGWYRVSVTMTQGGGSLFYGHIATSNSATPSYDTIDFPTYLGNGTSGVYIWGAQTQVGALTTYQPILTTPSAFMASQMKYNLKDARDLDAAFRLTWSGGWTYSATGATPNGTNAYADTKLVPSTAIASVNSNSLGYYSGSNLAETSSDPVNMGSTISGTQAINILKSNTNISSRLNGDILTYATAIMKGFFVATRPSSTVANLFFNGSKVSTITPNGTLPIYSVLIGTTAFGSSPYAQGYVKNDFRFAFIADGLTDTDSLLLNQITEKYQVALSRGVQAAQSFYYNSAYSNEANTYLYSTQITGTTQVSAINTLINGLKANNLWSKMKAVYPFVTDKTLQSDMATQMKFNLVNPQDSDAAFRLAFSGGWTYSTNGIKGNGVNTYMNTFFNPATYLTTNSFSVSVYRNNFNIPYGSDIAMYGGGSGYYYLSTGLNTESAIAFNGFGNTYAETSHLGLFTLNALSGITTGYKNGISKLSYSTTGTLPSTNSFIGANAFGGGTEFSNNQYGFAIYSNGLSDAEALILYNLIQAFQTTLSRQV